MGTPGDSLVSAPRRSGARGSSGLVGQEEGTVFAWGAAGTLREGEVQLSPPQNPFSKYPSACLATAANHSTS